MKGNKNDVNSIAAIIICLFLVFAILGFLSMSGCTSNPVPNITIGSPITTMDAEGICSPGNVTITIITDSDKSLIGDDTELNDEDGLTRPSVGL